MFKIKDYKVIAEKGNRYLSFPDVIRSKKFKDTLYLIYRSADGHHPMFSYLYVLKSKDNGETWKEIDSVYLNLTRDGYVFNCPRFCYFPDGSLKIVCDIKSGLDERTCNFKTILMEFEEEISQICYKKFINLIGMVPDRVVSFKGNLYCANHIRYNNSLIQLINCSKDGGATWFDQSVLARKNNYAFCEASIINYKNKCLIAYMRNDYSGRKMGKYISSDGVNWEDKGVFPVFGHRPTTLYDIESDRLIMSYRNTKNVGVYILTADIGSKFKEENIRRKIIEKEYSKNKFHCGYTGIAKINKNFYFLTYYIMKDKPNSIIKSCIVEVN